MISALGNCFCICPVRCFIVKPHLARTWQHRRQQLFVPEGTIIAITIRGVVTGTAYAFMQSIAPASQLGCVWVIGLGHGHLHVISAPQLMKHAFYSRQLASSFLQGYTG